MTDKKQNGNAGLAAGAVVAGIAAAAAGYYFYMSKDAKKHRKIVADWAGDFKKEVVKDVKALSHVSQETVMEVIDNAVEVYKKTRNIGENELMQAANELKENWDKLQKSGKKVTKRAKKTVAKVKKVVKKTTKKK